MDYSSSLFKYSALIDFYHYYLLFLWPFVSFLADWFFVSCLFVWWRWRRADGVINGSGQINRCVDPREFQLQLASSCFQFRHWMILPLVSRFTGGFNHPLAPIPTLMNLFVFHPSWSGFVRRLWSLVSYLRFWFKNLKKIRRVAALFDLHCAEFRRFIFVIGKVIDYQTDVVSANSSPHEKRTASASIVNQGHKKRCKNLQKFMCMLPLLNSTWANYCWIMFIFKKVINC